jgi:catechol 2,3-dioxygenase-like lactoylglutathione lyase family enzyme
MVQASTIDDCQSSDQEKPVSRVQLALNVNDLGAAIEFYSKLFGAEPAKVRDGYANFAIAEPPLKLVLIENPGAGGSLNHLGIEVEHTDQVTAATRRLRSEGLLTDVEENVTCCFAVQDKVWVHGADGEPWEVYTVLADAPVMHEVPTPGVAQEGCCGTDPAAEPVTFTTRPQTCC